jgi:internalin A
VKFLNFVRLANFLVLMLGFSFRLGMADDSIFPDKALEAAVRQEVFSKRHSEEPLTADDVKNISRVIGKGKKIASLEGLQHCKAVMEIDLENNAISDLGPLAELKLLQSVNLAGNQIVSIDALKNLVALQYLELSRNQVVELGPLAEMTNMRSLYLSDNQIASLEPLAKMKKLWTLYAARNPLKDVATLAELTWLESLDLQETGLTSVEPLRQLGELKRLMLRKNQLADLGPLVAACEADANGPRRFAPFLKLDVLENPLSETGTTQLKKLQEFGVRVAESKPAP